MKRIKLLSATLAALTLSSISLVAVAQSASTAQTVRVTEQSYRITLSAKPKAGVVKFVVRNASGDGHDFWLKGGGKTWKTRILGGSGSTTVTASLKKGVKYTYWCAIGSHRQKGMSGSFVAR
jgi:hypothetical protein